MLKRFLSKLSLMLIVFCLSFQSLAADLSYNEIVFFGDSLTDNGNFYKTLFYLAPKSPPYYQGRFTNGPTWAERVADYFQSNYNVKSENNAIAGATTLLRNPFQGYFPFTLSSSVNGYIIRNAFKDKSHTLYIIWIGSNDYLYGAENVDKTTTDVVSTIQNNIEKLISRGGKNFLIFNVGDISHTPQGLTGGVTQNVNDLTIMHNKKLELTIWYLQNAHKDININVFDAYHLSGDIVRNPEKFNNTQHTHFSNYSDSCWKGGYVRGMHINQHEVLTNTIESHMSLANRLTDKKQVRNDAEQLATIITTTPDLAVAYEAGESYQFGGKACLNPDNYIFWDKVHPTAAVHAMMSNVIIDYIKEHYQ